MVLRLNTIPPALKWVSINPDLTIKIDLPTLIQKTVRNDKSVRPLLSLVIITDSVKSMVKSAHYKQAVHYEDRLIAYRP